MLDSGVIRLYYLPCWPRDRAGSPLENRTKATPPDSARRDTSSTASRAAEPAPSANDFVDAKASENFVTGPIESGAPP
jgi:hypothetical protein